MTHRATARIVGVLFIMATGAIILSVVILEPVVKAPDFLMQVSEGEARVAAGVLFEMVNNIAVVGIAVVIYPVLKPFSERLALGYIAARSIESVLFTIGTGLLLTLLFVSDEFVAAGAPPASYFHTLGGMLLAGHDLDNASGGAGVGFMAVGIGTLTLNYALFRTRLVPRWISAFGLFAGASILAARVMAIAGLELSPVTVTLMDAPIFVEEMVVAVWLIVKGFNASALAGGPQELVPSTE